MEWWLNVHSAYIEINLLEDTSTVSLASCIKVKAAVGLHAYWWADEAVLQNWVIGSVLITIWQQYLDQSLTMSTHIIKKCSLAILNLSCIWSIKSYMDTDSLKTTVQALCISHLDYTNALFYGLPTKDINCLQLVQNSCVKLVFGKTRYDSSTACLKQLHWLPVKFWIKFKNSMSYA